MKTFTSKDKSIISEFDPTLIDRYLATRPKKALALHKFLSKNILINESTLILSPGASYAVYESELQKLSNARVIASDIDKKAIATLSHDNLIKLVGDAIELPFASDTFDLIILPQVLEHIPEYEKCISSLDRVLKTKGSIYIHVPNPKSIIPNIMSYVSFRENTKEALSMVFKFYRNKFRSDYIKNRVAYHAGFTKYELVNLFQGYECNFLYWERFACEFDNYFGRAVASIGKKLPSSFGEFFESELFLIAKKK